MELNEKNYFSKENNLKYVSSSQIHSFQECEAKALAMIKGEWQEEKSIALLQSSYIDEYFSGTLSIFKQEHIELFKKDGELKAEYKMLDDIIQQAENDPMFIKYLRGGHQIIETGEIEGVPVKIKIDSFFPEKLIVDLKAIKDFELLWDSKEKTKKNFIDYYNYVLQAALYQEIVFQKTGKKLPFVIAAMTKEKYSERALLLINQEKMDERLEEIKPYLTRIQDIKLGKIEPQSCGRCQYCISKQKCSEIWNYDSFFVKRYE